MNHHWSARLLSLLLCCVCLLGLVRPVSAESADVAETQELPMATTTVVRNGAYAGARVIGQMEDGTMVTVLSQHGDYYKVDCYDMTGYIAASQLVHTEEDKYYVNCKPDSEETWQLSYTPHGQALQLRHSLLELAQQQLGTPYVYGGSRPGGFDCSGFLYYLYGQHGIGIHRTASAQLQDGIVVAKDGMQVGDLVFFRESWSGYPASHIGIYAGNNQIIHAGNNGIGYADLDSPYFAENYLCARRVIHTDAPQMHQQIDPIARAVVSRGGVSGRRAG